MHGETLTLAPEPTSGTGLHGEKLGAARTHEPNRQVRARARVRVRARVS